MRRLTRILGVLVLLLALGAGVFALMLAHDADCPPAPVPADGPDTMQAIRAHCYGDTGVLALERVARPVPAAGEVLVRVHAAGVNPLDWHGMAGQPYVMRLGTGLGRPDDAATGVDFAGTVAAVGDGVTRFKVGDAVFGGRKGAFAEYLVVRADRNIALKPAGVGFAEAAAVPIAAITALQALRDAGAVGPGQKVLINGASGGVGTYAVQIAKAMGAEVTGVSSGRNLELVRSLGADATIDYTRQDFTEGDARYDVILDNVGNRSLSAYRRALTGNGTLVMVTGPKTDRWLGPVTRLLWAKLTSPFVAQRQVTLLASLDPADLEVLRGMLADGTLRPVIDRRFPLSATAEAIDYLEQGRTRGKNVIEVIPASEQVPAQ